jgi:hypothetical protein
MSEACPVRVRTHGVGDDDDPQKRQRGNRMNEGDRFQLTLDVAVVQLNNGRARLQFKTDSGTIVRFWYDVESLTHRHTLHNWDPHARNRVLGASAGP